LTAAGGTKSRGHAEVLKIYMAKHGLKASRQRDVIADVFFSAGGHLSIEDLLVRARKIDGKVSQATVYRTMKLLTDCGLAHARNFQDGQTRYEVSDHEHHDHLICTRCGRIVEFVEPKIEQLQDKVASRHGFVVTDHKMELYGLCGDCRRSTQ
jgi:Fur family ferric uptake transcriptional regulator